jgi:hypothetical protein
MTLNKFRGFLYWLARTLGDVQAVRRKRKTRRVQVSIAAFDLGGASARADEYAAGYGATPDPMSVDSVIEVANPALKAYFIM